jgi:hypothetical protein
MAATTPKPAGGFEKRSADALTSCMIVLEDLSEVADDPEKYAVVSDSGSMYIVDTRARTCDCEDMLFRRPDGGCRHLRRVDYARGAVPIPGWADRSAIDAQLGQHLTASPRIATAGGRTEVFES